MTELQIKAIKDVGLLRLGEILCAIIFIMVITDIILRVINDKYYSAIKHAIKCKRFPKITTYQGGHYGSGLHFDGLE